MRFRCEHISSYAENLLIRKLLNGRNLRLDQIVGTDILRNLRVDSPVIPRVGVGLRQHFGIFRSYFDFEKLASVDGTIAFDQMESLTVRSTSPVEPRELIEVRCINN